MNEDDIEDGSQDDPKDAIGTRNDARLKIYEEIADSVEEEMIKEGQLTKEELEWSDEARKAEPVEDEPEEVTPQKYKLKVNGKELELTLEEVLTRAQKVEAADDYLRQAHEAQKQFSALALAQPPQISAPDQAKTEPSQDVQEPDDLALARALQVGTEEDAAKVIRQLRTSTAINPDVVASQVLNQIARNTALDQFKKDYKDIADDPNLLQLAFSRDETLLKGGDRRAYAERYSSIGDEIRSWLGKKVPATSFEEKKERKSATVTPIKAASARAVQPSDDEQEEDTSSVIAQMARSRNQRYQ